MTDMTKTERRAAIMKELRDLVRLYVGDGMPGLVGYDDGVHPSVGATEIARYFDEMLDEWLPGMTDDGFEEFTNRLVAHQFPKDLAVEDLLGVLTCRVVREVDGARAIR